MRRFPARSVPSAPAFLSLSFTNSALSFLEWQAGAAVLLIAVLYLLIPP